MQEGVSGLRGRYEGVAAEMIPNLVLVALLHFCFFYALKDGVVDLDMRSTLGVI